MKKSSLSNGGREVCLVCGASEWEVRFPGTFRGSVDDAVDYFLASRSATAHGDIVECDSCGFRWTTPRFESHEYDAIYRAVARKDTTGLAMVRANSVRCRRLSRLVARYADRNAPFLDFGCGDGSFLREFGNPNGLGFEVGRPSQQQEGAYRIITGAWNETACSELVPEHSLDYLTAFDVFEHLPNIQEDLTLIRKTLRDGALLFVTVPNASSITARLMGKYWNMLLLEHLWYFSPRGLVRLLRRHGFQLLESRAIPYDAPIGHIISRIGQSFNLPAMPISQRLNSLVMPTPAGVMFGVFRAVDEGQFADRDFARSA